MLFIDIVLIFLVIYSLVPLLTGKVAKEYGHSFWRWFGLAWVLPILAQVVLYFVLTRDEKREAAEKARGGPGQG
jgi:uncharacterized membrane protein